VTVPFMPGAAPVDPETLTAIAGACRDRERLRFSYRGRDGAESRRYVEPHKLVSVGHRWYVVAWDRDRGEWRTFRLDRLSRARTDGTRFEPRCVPRGDAAAFVTASMASAAYRYQARVTVFASFDDVTARLKPFAGDVRPLDSERCEYRTGDDSLDWLVVRLGMLGFEFVVEEPEELRERLREVAGRYARAGGA
jgi:predicted DNA-binding transcriptional regulator YafY